MSYKLIDAPLLTADQIRTRVYELAQAIESTTSEPLHLIAVLKGSIVFLADLIRAMRGPITLDFIAVSSYDANVSSGAVHLLKDIDTNIKDRSVVVIEDIVDTGLTLEYIQTLLRSKNLKPCNQSAFSVNRHGVKRRLSSTMSVLKSKIILSSVMA